MNVSDKEALMILDAFATDGEELGYTYDGDVFLARLLEAFPDLRKSAEGSKQSHPLRAALIEHVDGVIPPRVR